MLWAFTAQAQAAPTWRMSLVTFQQEAAAAELVHSAPAAAAAKGELTGLSARHLAGWHAPRRCDCCSQLAASTFIRRF